MTDAQATPLSTVPYHRRLRQSIKREVQDELRRIGVIGTTIDGSHVGGLGYVNNYLLDNGGVPLTIEPRPYIRFRGLKSRLIAWSLLGQPPLESSIRLDIAKAEWALFEDLGLTRTIIDPANPPRLDSEWAREERNLAGWNDVTFQYGDVLRISLTEVDGITTFVTLSLELERIV